MSLLTIYKEKNEDLVWKEKFFSSAKGKKGKVFECINTNFRSLSSYRSHFKSFDPIAETERSEWVRSPGHNQEVDKQRVVPLREAKFFQRKVKQNVISGVDPFVYKRTAKGDSYKRFIESNIEGNEGWVIDFLYLLDGIYENHPNHIANKTEEILNIFNSINFQNQDLDELFGQAIETGNMNELLKKDLFYILSFYDDIEFLEIYLSASEEEKKEMHDYIIKNRNEKNKECCISHKTETAGIYPYGTAIDEIKIFYFTNLLLDSKSLNVETSLINFLQKYKEILNINIDNVISYLKEEHKVIDSVLLEVFEIEDDLPEIDGIRRDEVLEDEEPEPFIDSTTKEGKTEMGKIFAKKKKFVIEMSGYKCALSKYRTCDNHYFRSKKTEKNYVEVHHLIPRAVSNLFEYSIEVTPNYVVLCPGCHSLIHKAVDIERKRFIMKLISERKEKLAVLKIDIELDELYKYYDIIEKI